MMQSRKTVLDRNKKELVDSINTSNKVYNNEELSILVNQQRDEIKILKDSNKALTDRATILETNNNNLTNKLNTLESGFINYQKDSLNVKRVLFGKYFQNKLNYVVIKLGNLKLDSYEMIMITLKIYQYDHLNTLNIGGYAYGTQMYSPTVSYLQKTYKTAPIFFGSNSSKDLYLVIRTELDYTGIWIDEIATMHSSLDLISSGWTINQTDNISDLRLYQCSEI